MRMMQKRRKRTSITFQNSTLNLTQLKGNKQFLILYLILFKLSNYYKFSDADDYEYDESEADEHSDDASFIDDEEFSDDSSVIAPLNPYMSSDEVIDDPDLHVLGDIIDSSDDEYSSDDESIIYLGETNY